MPTNLDFMIPADPIYQVNMLIIQIIIQNMFVLHSLTGQMYTVCSKTCTTDAENGKRNIVKV